MLSQEKLIRITFYNGIKSSSRRLLRCFALAVSAGDGRSNPQFWPESEASRSSPERYPIAGMMDQFALRSAGITGPAPRRSISQRRDRAPRPGRRVGSCYPAPAARGSRPLSGSVKAGHPSSGGRGASAGPGSSQGTVGRHPGMDGDCQAELPASGVPRRARGKAGQRVTALSTTCRAIELDADSGGGTLLTPRPPNKVIHRSAKLPRGLY